MSTGVVLEEWMPFVRGRGAGPREAPEERPRMGWIFSMWRRHELWIIPEILVTSQDNSYLWAFGLEREQGGNRSMNSNNGLLGR